MELSKKDSKMLQGLSVLAMICLHLFDTWDYADKFTPLVYVGGVPMSFYVGQISDFCVFGFAFLSGYAHMLQYGKKDFYKHRLKGLLSLLCSYWLILIVFSLVSIAVGQEDYMPGSIRKFILSVLLLESYNGAWWYLFTYASLVFISPLVLKWIKRRNPIFVLGIGFGIYCAAYYFRFKMSYSNWLLGRFGPFGMTFFEYMLGAVAYKYQVFSWLYRVWQRIPKPAQYLLSVVLIAGMLYARTKIVPSLFVAPITGFVLMMLFHFWKKPEVVQKAFLIVGSHSTNIWLTHMFFYLYLFKNLVYVAKYPLLIFAFMLAITIPLSALLKWIEKPIQAKIATL